MSIQVTEDGQIIREGSKANGAATETAAVGEDASPSLQVSEYHAEIISIENIKAHGIQIPSVEQLKLKFKPVAVISFINTQDETDRTNLLCRRIDPLTYNKLSSETTFINYIAKLVEIRDFVQAKDLESGTVDVAELADLLDPDRILESKFSEDLTAYAIAAHCIVAPRIPIRQILYVLPIAFVNVVSEFCVGGVTEFDELIDGFRIEIQYL